ncbi:MAG: KH domain-containing protein [Candidatus Aenigmatarchaeota archaeon]
MNTPICEVCLKSDILCAACKEKLEKKKISEIDIEVSKFLYELSSKVSSLNNLKLLKVYEATNMLVILVGKGNIPIIIGKGGSVIKSISKKFSKNIKIIEEGSNNYYEIGASLLSNPKIYGINIVFKNGEEIYKFRIPSLEKQKIEPYIDDFSKLFKQIFNKNAIVCFE